MRFRDERGSAILRGLGWLLTAMVLGGLLVVAAAFTSSVVVQGDSMQPTVTTGDRIVVNPFGTTAQRFDIVEGSFAGFEGSAVIKRVIGLPGDRVSVETPQGDRPNVLVRPADGSGTFAVDNPRWSGQVGTRVLGCCSSDGSAGKRGQTRWSTVPTDSYWVIGDNWGGSDDSRTYGFMKATDIRGVAVWRLTPLDSFGRLENADISLEPAR